MGAQLCVAGHAVHLGQCSLLIGPEQPPCLVVRFRFLAPPFLAEQHFQAGGIAVPAGRLLRLGRLQVGRAPHHARDALRALRGLLRRSAGKALTLAVPHQQRADVLAAGPLAVFVVRAGAAGADKAAIFPQPDLGLVRILYPVRVGLGPREYRAAQQVADLFHVHPGSPSLCNALLVKHTAPAGGMQGFCRKNPPPLLQGQRKEALCINLIDIFNLIRVTQQHPAIRQHRKFIPYRKVFQLCLLSTFCPQLF